MVDESKAVIDWRSRPFFIMSRDIIDKDPQLEKPVDLAVYAVLCMYADNTDKTSHPKVETIAKKARCSERVARRSLQALKDAGYIDIRKRADARGFQTSNQYILLDIALA